MINFPTARNLQLCLHPSPILVSVLQPQIQDE